MPCHHNLEHYLPAYIDGTKIGGDPKGPLFRTIGRRTRRLTRTPLPQANAWAMVRCRARQAGLATKVCNHSSTRTTQLYDRRSDEVTLDEVERVGI